jgi:uncharacterized membrane protein YsdA (DUF1294 family)
MPEKTNMLTIIMFYLVAANAIGYAMMWYDKRCAQLGQWRIKERTLLTIALIGGSLGSTIGMYQFRHKTKHPSFTIGIPFMIALQITIIIIVKMKLQGEILHFIKSWI